MLLFFKKSIVRLILICKFVSCICLPIRNRWAFFVSFHQVALHLALQSLQHVVGGAVDIEGGSAFAAVS